MTNNFIKFIPRADLGKTSAQRGLLLGQRVHLFVNVRGETVLAAIAILSDVRASGRTSFRRRLYKHDLSCNADPEQVAIRAQNFQEQSKTLSYPYSFFKSDDVPKMQGKLYTSGPYAWDYCAMPAVSAFAGFKPVLASGGER